MAPRLDSKPKAVTRTAVLVLGLHRSGLTAMSRIANLLGAAAPHDLALPDPEHPDAPPQKNQLVAIHDELLEALDSSWDDWRPLGSRWKDGEMAAAYAEKLVRAIAEEFENAPLFALNDPRMCRALPFWMSVLQTAGARSAPIIVVRNPLEVAKSLGQRDGVSLEKAMLLWLRYNLEAEYETRHLPRNIVAFDALLEDWKLIAVQTGARLGVTWPRTPVQAAQEVREFLSDDHYHSRASLAELEQSPNVAQWVKDAYRALMRLCDEPKAAEPKRELDRIRHAFAEDCKAFGAIAYAETARANRYALEAEFATRRAEAADSMSAELAVERVTAEELRQALAARETAISEVQAELAKTQAKADKALKRAQNIEAALALAKAESKEAGDAADEFERRADASTLRISELVEAIAEHERREADAQATVAQMTKEAGEAKASIAELSERVKRLEKDLKAQIANAERTANERDEARTSVSELSAALQTALTSAAKLAEELSIAKEQASGHHTAAQEASAEARKNYDELAAAQARIAAIEAHERTARDEAQKLRDELTAAIAGDSTKNKSSAELKRAVREAEARVTRLEDDLRVERGQVLELQKRFSSLPALVSAAMRRMVGMAPKKPPATPTSSVPPAHIAGQRSAV